MLGGDRCYVPVGGELGGPAGERRAEGKERHEREPVLVGELKDILAAAIEDAEGVLHAGQLGYPDRFLQQCAGHVAHADELDRARFTQLHQRAELVGQRDLRAAVLVIHHPQVDGDPVDPQRPQVVLDALLELLRAVPGQPPAPLVAARADLGHQREVLRVGRQTVAYQLVDHVGSVVLGGVDVVHTELDRSPQDRPCGIGIARGPEDPRSG